MYPGKLLFKHARMGQKLFVVEKFCPLGQPRMQAWHLMQIPETTDGSSLLIEPIGQSAAQRPQRSHFSESVCGADLRNFAGFPLVPVGI